MRRILNTAAILSILGAGLMATSEADASCRRNTCRRAPSPRPPATTFRRGNPPAPRGPAFVSPPGFVPGPGANGPVAPSGPVGPVGPVSPVGPQTNDRSNQTISIPAGATILLPGNHGAKPGTVYLVLDGVRLPLIIDDWAPEGITVTLPPMQLTSAKQVRIEIVSSAGAAEEGIDIVLTPPAKVVVQVQPVVVTAPPAPVGIE